MNGLLRLFAPGGTKIAGLHRRAEEAVSDHTEDTSAGRGDQKTDATRPRHCSQPVSSHSQRPADHAYTGTEGQKEGPGNAAEGPPQGDGSAAPRSYRLARRH